MHSPGCPYTDAAKRYWLDLLLPLQSNTAPAPAFHNNKCQFCRHCSAAMHARIASGGPVLSPYRHATRSTIVRQAYQADRLLYWIISLTLNTLTQAAARKNQNKTLSNAQGMYNTAPQRTPGKHSRAHLFQVKQT